MYLFARQSAGKEMRKRDQQIANCDGKSSPFCYANEKADRVATTLPEAVARA
jgi:hypothetical protein